MGPSRLKWFLPICNSIGNGLSFPVSEDVRGILRGMRGDLGRFERGMENGEYGGSVDDDEDDEDERVYRRDGPGGRWMVHD